MSSLHLPVPRDGSYIDVQESHLSFGFNIEESREGKNGMKVFVIDVDFAPGKRGSLTIEAKTLKIALEMIETVARETADLSPFEFEEFKNNFSVKPLYMTVSHDRGEKGEDKTDTLQIYKANRTRDGFEPITREKRSHGLTIEVLKEIDELARELDPSRPSRREEHIEEDDRDEDDNESVGDIAINLRRRDSDLGAPPSSPKSSVESAESEDEPSVKNGNRESGVGLLSDDEFEEEDRRIWRHVPRDV